MNLLCLVIKDWWSDLAEYYQFEHDHYIMFRYVGENKFHVTVYTGNASLSFVLTFLEAIHRALQLSDRLFCHFTLITSLYQCYGPYLVIVLLLSKFSPILYL